MANSRRKKHSSGILVRLILFTLFCGLLFLLFGQRFFGRWLPSSERKDLNEWFEVQGDEVKLFVDGGVVQDVTGRRAHGTVYIPFGYVSDRLNGRFFYSTADNMVSYTLPDETADFDEKAAIGGAPAFVREDGDVFLSLDLIGKYTNIYDERFTGESESACRVFLWTGGDTVLRSAVREKDHVRTGKAVSAPILTTIEKGRSVYVTERTDKWSRVITEDGIAGFVRTGSIAVPEEYTFPVCYEEPVVSHTLADGKVIMGWQGIYNSKGNESLEDFLESAGEYINVISPTWIQISGADGAFISYSDAEYVREAHEAGLQVWACVDNFNQEAGRKDFSTRDHFALAANRRDFIRRLMEDASACGYDGFNLDFEGLPADAGESFAQFFRELSVECRRAGLILSIDNYVPYRFMDHYNMEEQGVFADYVIVMLYNEHTDEPGSNASLPFTEFGIAETTARVPSERVIAALPLYTRVWTVQGGEVSSEALSITGAARYAEEQDMKLQMDELTGQNYGERTENDVVTMLWMEDGDSLRAKMELVGQYGLGGIAVWRLGYDTSEIWKELAF